MEKITPRPYQTRAVRQALALTRAGKKVLVNSPGGSGKTVMIAMIVKRGLAQKKTVLVVAHRRELLAQARHHLERMGVRREVIGGDGSPVQVLGIAIAVKRAAPADYILIDEAHRAAAATYLKLVAAHRHARVIGFTATPTRLGGKGLQDAFDELITVSSIPRLIKKGVLSKPVCFTDKESLLPNLLNLSKSHGDYLVSQLFSRVSTRHIVGGIVENIKRHARGDRVLLFAVNRKHARICADQLNEGGVLANYADGEMPDKERDAAIEAFRAGRVQVLCNCLLLGEGFDLPDCRVVVMAAPTMSYVKFQQQAARVMRPHKKRAVLLDHARNISRHWLPYFERKFTLEGGLQKGDPVARPKTCSSCFAIGVIGARVCENCGHMFPRKERKLPVEIEKELTEFSVAKSDIMSRVREYARKNKCPDFLRRVQLGFKETGVLIVQALNSRGTQAEE
jgi:superfamily II DNA or RNA helicase